MGKWLAAAALTAGLVAGSGSGSATAAEHHGAPACSPDGTSLTLTAKGHKFDRDCLAVPGGESFTIRFDNQDNDRHSVAIVPSRGSNEPLYTGNILAGPKNALLTVGKLKDGTYLFQCDVHPNLMNGTFVVGSGGPVPDATPAPAAAPAPAPTPAPANPRSAAAADTSPAAAPAPAPKPAPASGSAAVPGENRAATGAIGPDGLPRTGPASRPLLLLAGFVLAAGGLSVVAGARRTTI